MSFSLLELTALIPAHSLGTALTTIWSTLIDITFFISSYSPTSLVLLFAIVNNIIRKFPIMILLCTVIIAYNPEYALIFSFGSCNTFSISTNLPNWPFKALITATGL
eukprot:NODE_125_length_18781_cov_0.243015.p11 type:complete len:107 gc:universal NODE_125_length_18781_cov_0.243015:6173-5853(-)